MGHGRGEGEGGVRPEGRWASTTGPGRSCAPSGRQLFSGWCGRECCCRSVGESSFVMLAPSSCEGIRAMTSVDFQTPPIEEVVCGVLYQPVTAMKTALLGMLWGKFIEEFPKTEDVQVLLRQRQNEILSQPFPRVWFLTQDETCLLQLQQDRFHYNWRRNSSESSEYPHFDAVHAAFARHFRTFREALSDTAPIAPKVSR